MIVLVDRGLVAELDERVQPQRPEIWSQVTLSGQTHAKQPSPEMKNLSGHAVHNPVVSEQFRHPFPSRQGLHPVPVIDIPTGQAVHAPVSIEHAWQ